MRRYNIRKIVGVMVAMAVFLGVATPVHADGGISLSPMTGKIILSPGETYSGSVTVFNQASNENDLSYKAEVLPFFVDEDYNSHYDNEYGDYNQIVDWITLSNDTGVLPPNSGADIHYTIKVPEDAPAGGQYAGIRVSNALGESTAGGEGLSTNVKVSYGIAYNIFAEVTGVDRHEGEIIDVNLPSFLLSGDIIGSAGVKNTGNVHGTAKYTLQVYPLFSNEEVYTNEESPDEKIVLPDRTLYSETAWGGTPIVGVFNVIYTVEFEGVTTQVSKLVIKCPIWLLFIIIFVIFAIIFWLMMRVRSRKKSGGRKKSVEANTVGSE